MPHALAQGAEDRRPAQAVQLEVRLATVAADLATRLVVVEAKGKDLSSHRISRSRCQLSHVRWGHSVQVVDSRGLRAFLPLIVACLGRPSLATMLSQGLGVALVIQEFLQVIHRGEAHEEIHLAWLGSASELQKHRK
ncbi:hypothetical protein LEN26_017999 [Aphanomyces euteiches]|nr:hypothetical protein LEN26_017999 [Aphanomyces euteiches]